MRPRIIWNSQTFEPTWAWLKAMVLMFTLECGFKVKTYLWAELRTITCLHRDEELEGKQTWSKYLKQTNSHYFFKQDTLAGVTNEVIYYKCNGNMFDCPSQKHLTCLRCLWWIYDYKLNDLSWTVHSWPFNSITTTVCIYFTLSCILLD